MKGQNEVFLLIISIFLVVLIVVGIMNFLGYFGKGSFYDNLANPLVWGAGKLTETAADKFIDSCKEVMNEVESLFVYDEIERECSRWYDSCTEELDYSPQNPWKKMQLSESDLETVNYLKQECMTSGINEIIDRWSDKSGDFNSKNEYEKYTMIKNTCGSTIVSRMYE